MKKTIAIFFLVIFLFNVGGYHMFFWGLRLQAKNDLLDRVEADTFSSEEVVVLRLPISIPYPMPNEGYERATGEVEYKGEFYHLIKQKIADDTLFMVCVKDQQQKHLQRTLNEFTNLANNLPISSKNTMDLLGKLFKDYTHTTFSLHPTLLMLSKKVDFAEKSFPIFSMAFPVDSPPPELI